MRLRPRDFTSLEGRLYGLHGTTDARPATASFSPRSTPSYGPRGPFLESIPGLDLDIAVKSLSAYELTIIEQHYLSRSQRHPVRVRRQVVEHLFQLLREES